MRYHETVEDYVKRYCETMDIPINNGVIPVRYRSHIMGVVNAKIKSDRINNRRTESINCKVLVTDIMVEEYFGKVESPIEDFMLSAIVNAGWEKHCRPQFEIGKKRVDFAFPIAHLVVECDGKEYHFTDQRQIDNDQKRDQYLAKKGWMVLHFDGLLIRRNIQICIENIGKHLNPFLNTVKNIPA